MKVIQILQVKTQGKVGSTVLNRSPSLYSFPALKRRSKEETSTQGRVMGRGYPTALRCPPLQHWDLVHLVRVWMLYQVKQLCNVFNFYCYNQATKGDVIMAVG